ncbi:MAG TPA: TonB family protein [Candidatus Polarisedimenticolaceae bacterium]|nr:TonB family protein [Candidatus Polarisedimenticolaceae bacterium]
MSQNRIVLVIDYDPRSIQATAEPLRRAGFQVEVRNDGEAGLRAFRELSPALVLIEPMIPRKHGFQVCREIKRSPIGRTTPVVITTAFYRGRRHELAARREYGCDDYLEKPLGAEELLARCRALLERSPVVVSAGGGPREARPLDQLTGMPEPPEMPEPDQLDRPAFPSLGEITDDEIEARLDGLIDDGEASAVDEPRLDPAAPPAWVAKEKATRRAPVGASRVVVSAALVDAGGASPMARRPRWPLWVAVVAVVCLLTGGAMLWWLADTAPQLGPPLQGSLPATATAEVPPSTGTGLHPSTAREVQPSGGRDGSSLARVHELSGVDRAPVPLRRDPPRYPPPARETARQGTVAMRLLVDETGAVREVELTDGTASDELNHAALDAARGWSYTPASKDGANVAVWIEESVEFKL